MHSSGVLANTTVGWNWSTILNPAEAAMWKKECVDAFLRELRDAAGRNALGSYLREERLKIKSVRLALLLRVKLSAGAATL